MKNCPNCYGSLKVSVCHHAQLLYCKNCQWGMVSFDEDLDMIMNTEEEEEYPMIAEDFQYLSKFVLS